MANAFESLAGRRLEDWGRLQLYPACRLLYGLGISALAARHYYLAWQSLTSIVVETEKNMPLAFGAHTLYCIRQAPLGINGKLAGSKYVALHLPSELSELIPARRDFEFLFDSFEYLWSLVLADLNQPGILGQFAIKSMHGLIAWAPQWKEDVSANGSESEFLRSGVFDGSLERYKAAENAISEAISKFY